MPFRYAIVFAVSWVLSTGLWARGDWSSGGGDILPILFQEGRIEATQLLQDLDSKMIKLGPPRSRAERAAIDFLLKHHQALSKEIRFARLRWQEGPHSQTKKCARTALGERGASINLSLENCSRIDTSSEAAKVLIHEATHHFFPEPREEFADLVALFAYLLWHDQLEHKATLCPKSFIGSIASPDSHDWRVLSVPLKFLSVFRSENHKLVWHNLSNHLYGKWQSGGDRARIISFVFDQKVLDLFPPFSQCIFSPGWMSFDEDGEGDRLQRMPFVTMSNAKGFYDLIVLETKGGIGPVSDEVPKLTRFRAMINPLSNHTRSDDLMLLSRYKTTSGWVRFKRVP